MFDILEELGDVKAPEIRIGWNVLPMIDYLTSVWVKGTRGEMIQVGGFTHNTGVVAQANCGKTELAAHIFSAAVNRIPHSDGSVYESESTLQSARLNRISNNVGLDICGANYSIPSTEELLTAKANGDTLENRIVMIDGELLPFDKWFDKMTKIAEKRNKLRKNTKELITLPFNYSTIHGNKVLKPHFVLVDSVSEAQIESAEDSADTHGVDHKKDNMSFGRDGLIKTKIFKKINVFSTLGDIYVVSTGSVDDKWADIGGMPGARPEKAMSHLPMGKEIKGCGTSYKKRTSNLWTFGKSKPFFKGTGSADRYPKYPYDKDDNYLGNLDLEIVVACNLRGKGGPSGLALPIARSQRGGICSDVMMFETLRNVSALSATNDPHADYGLHVPKQYHFALDLLPDIHFRNTNFREKCREHPELLRALELTYGMKMSFYVNPLPDIMAYEISPAELYKQITDLKYDWRTLLDTRSWFTAIEAEDKFAPFLSIFDLLRMGKEEYRPFWMKVNEK